MELNQIEVGVINNVISSIYEKFYDHKQNNLESEVAFDVYTSFKIIEKASNIFKNEDAVLQISTSKPKAEFVIVGDLHGSLDSLIRIFDEKGYPNTTRYLFLGDYVDRGSNSCEVIILLYSLKILYPENIYLIRGNHEFRCITDQYGFKAECYNRVKKIVKRNTYYDGRFFYHFVTESFKFLPICAILDDSIFCVHGGITSQVHSRDELLKISKVGVHFSMNDSVQAELLWNDPSNSILTYCHSPRGLGYVFGKSALDYFLEKMNFSLVIRGHQSESEGYNWSLGENNGILTVFSAIDYCGTLNHGSVAVISNKENELVNVYQFEITEQSNQYLAPQDCIENNFDFMNANDIILNLNIDEYHTLID